MRIVDVSVRMCSPDHAMLDFDIQHGIKMLRNIEYFARISHGSEDGITADSYDRFLRSVVISHGDLSVIEHEKVSCEFVVDRGITHEIVRHRLFSYTQESTRFINYKKKGGEAKVIKPLEITGYDQEQIWTNAMEVAERSYMRLLDEGIAPQIARSVFPTCLASKIAMTGNLRSWRHFFIMRTSKETHPTAKLVTIPLLRKFQKNIPILLEDIIPEQRQIEAMKLPR